MLNATKKGPVKRSTGIVRNTASNWAAWIIGLEVSFVFAPSGDITDMA